MISGLTQFPKKCGAILKMTLSTIKQNISQRLKLIKICSKSFTKLSSIRQLTCTDFLSKDYPCILNSCLDLLWEALTLKDRKLLRLLDEHPTSGWLTRTPTHISNLPKIQMTSNKCPYSWSHWSSFTLRFRSLASKGTVSTKWSRYQSLTQYIGTS